MVQAWYQGGLSVFDWTDIDHPKEIAFFDRGPVDAEPHGDGRFVVGVLVQRRHRQLRDRARPRHLRAGAERRSSRENELDAAKTVKMAYWNTQDQQKFVWPPSFALARAYLDQLERSKVSPSETIASARTTLANAERSRDRSARRR